MQTIFRVDEVLRGDSPTVALVGYDVGDRQVRLEVPAALASGVRVGSALIIEWWAAEVPSAASGAATAGPSSAWPREPAAGDGGEAASATATPADSTPAASADEERLEQEFRALIGLR